MAEPGPRVLEDGRPHGGGEVESGAARTVQVDRGDDAEALRVALEAVEQPQPLPGEPVQHLLAQVPERRVPEVVGQRRRLDHVGVAAAERRHRWPRCAASALSCSAMARATWATCRLCVSRLCTSNPRPGRADHLGDPGQPGEERGRGDPVAVHPERAAGQAGPGLLHSGPPPGPPRLIDHSRDLKPCPLDRPGRTGR